MNQKSRVFNFESFGIFHRDSLTDFASVICLCISLHFLCCSCVFISACPLGSVEFTLLYDSDSKSLNITILRAKVSCAVFLMHWNCAQCDCGFSAVGSFHIRNLFHVFSRFLYQVAMAVDVAASVNSVVRFYLIFNATELFLVFPDDAWVDGCV